MDLMAISAVLLDVGGVFHVPHPGRLSPAAGRTLHLDDVMRAHYQAVAAMTDFAEDDEGVWRAYGQAFAASLGVPEAVNALLDAFDQPAVWSGIIPGSFDALRDLAATGVALAIVSNSDGTLEGRLRAERLCQVGDGDGVRVAIVCDSGACGVAKPDPAIFKLALAALDIDPADTVHVGDTYGADVVGARRAGVRPIHLDPFQLCADHDHEHAASLAGVVGMVSASRA
jgi:putative hydrolase of the HAD superfamily